MKHAVLFAIGFTIVACQPAPGTDTARESNTCIYSQKRLETYAECAKTDYKCAGAVDYYQQEIKRFCG